MTEKEIQKQIIKSIESINGVVMRMNSGKVRNNVRLCPDGTPDLLLLLPKQYSPNILWVEVKDAKGKLNQSQIDMHHKLTAMGHDVIVARSLDDVLFAIRRN